MNRPKNTPTDYTGYRNGKLTFVEKLPPVKTKAGNPSYKCRFRCDCGNTVIRKMYSVRATKYPTCGCDRGHSLRGQHIDRTLTDYAGFKRGSLTYVGRAPVIKTKGGNKIRKCRFRCDCGNEVTRVMQKVRRSEHPACPSCYKRSPKRTVPLYDVKAFKAFVIDQIGAPPSNNHTLGLNDPTLGYAAGNMRWAEVVGVESPKEVA